MINQFVCSLLFLIAAASTYAQEYVPVGIIGGVPTTTSARSYVVSVQNNVGTLCNGALCNEDTVITLASCLLFFSPSQLKVGVLDNSKLIHVLDYVSNPDFDFITVEHDVGLLKLAEPVSAKYVKLPSKQQVTGSTGVLTVWNTNKSLVDVSETIITADDYVSGKYNYEDGDLYGSNVCGLAADQACNGVVRSPLVSNSELVGLLAWGSVVSTKPIQLYTQTFTLRNHGLKAV